jgi:regulator of nucleoside diphosphate kinase
MTLTEVDRCRLGTLLNCTEAAGYGNRQLRWDLERRIEEAQTIPVTCTPRTLVTMNSTVVLVEVSSGQRETWTLVYPEDRDLIPHSVGILQQSGQCILGRRVGDIVQLTEGAKPRQFRIEAIPYQPEAAGASHL